MYTHPITYSISLDPTCGHHLFHQSTLRRMIIAQGCALPYSPDHISLALFELTLVWVAGDGDKVSDALEEWEFESLTVGNGVEMTSVARGTRLLLDIFKPRLDMGPDSVMNSSQSIRAPGVAGEVKVQLTLPEPTTWAVRLVPLAP